MSVTVTVLPDCRLSDDDDWLLSGWVVLTPEKASPEHGIVREPYVLMKGDYDERPMVDKRSSPPRLMDATDNWQFTDPTEEVVFRFTGTSFSTVELRTRVVTRVLEASIHNASTHKKLFSKTENTGPAMNVLWSDGRDLSSGTTSGKVVPDGKYYIQVSDAKANLTTSTPNATWCHCFAHR
ncbi:hypothetical protein RI367_002917 [Sorochytrium milnesiophthora]